MSKNMHKARAESLSGESDANLALQILDKLDDFRRRHQNDRHHPADWCMRVMEAIVAEAFGFQGRSSWTGALAADPNSRYYKDLRKPTMHSF